MKAAFMKGKKETVELVLLVLLLIFLAVFVLRDSKTETDIRIVRPEYGTKKQELRLRTQSGEEVSFCLPVQERSLGEEEREALFTQAKEYLFQSLSVITTEGENICFPDKSMQLPTEFGEGKVLLDWRSSNRERISADGTLYRERVKLVERVGLTVRFTIGEDSRDETIICVLSPYPEGTKEAELANAMEYLGRLEEEFSGEESFVLPEEIGEIRVLRKKEQKGALVLLPIFLLPFVLLVSRRQQQTKQKKEREKELKRRYPQMITKLTILYGAGLSFRSAWERMAAEYRKKPEDDRDCNPLRDEILLMVGEMDNGVPEGAAYGNFGRRINIKEYSRCVSLLQSQISRGSRGVGDKLAAEVKRAWEEKRAEAEKRGEEAQTKLLVPMVGMLFLVFMLVMIPAFMGM